jgi:hypothetical protein
MECWVNSARARLQYSNIPIPRLRFCLTLCAMLLALCSSAQAQQPAKIPRVGVLRGNSLPNPSVETFQQAMFDLGYVEGKNIVIGRVERDSALIFKPTVKVSHRFRVEYGCSLDRTFLAL